VLINIYILYSYRTVIIKNVSSRSKVIQDQKRKSGEFLTQTYKDKYTFVAQKKSNFSLLLVLESRDI